MKKPTTNNQLGIDIAVIAKGYNDLVDGLLVEHSQLGVHDKTKVVDLTTDQTLTNKRIYEL